MRHAHPTPETKAEATTRAEIETLRARLSLAIDNGANPWRIAEARRHVAKFDCLLASNTDAGLDAYAGFLSQWEWQVRDICGELVVQSQFARDVRAAQVIL